MAVYMKIMTWNDLDRNENNFQKKKFGIPFYSWRCPDMYNIWAIIIMMTSQLFGILVTSNLKCVKGWIIFWFQVLGEEKKSRVRSPINQLYPAWQHSCDECVMKEPSGIPIGGSFGCPHSHWCQAIGKMNSQLLIPQYYNSSRLHFCQ